MARKWKILALAWALMLLYVPLFLYEAFAPISTYYPFDLERRPALEVAMGLASNIWDKHNRELVQNPYGNLVGSIKYACEVESYLDLYQYTGEVGWLEKALFRIDHIVNYSDVNGDGVPSWGNYNETYGTFLENNPDWGAEFSVTDGHNSRVILETAKIILEDGKLRENAKYQLKAQCYIKVIKGVIEGWHENWVQVSPTEGYYPYDRFIDNKKESYSYPVVNAFAAIGTAEIFLSDLLKDKTYLEKPKMVANFWKSNLELGGDGAYIWNYSFFRRKGGLPPSREDISHGRTDVEFAVAAYLHNVTFDRTDMERFVNTYKKRMWRGYSAYPHLNYGVDGREKGSKGDLSDDTRSWLYLSVVDPEIWFFQYLNFNDLILHGFGGISIFWGVTPLLLYYPGDAAVAQSYIRGGRKLCETQHPLIFLAKAKLDEANQLANAGDAKAALKKAMEGFRLALKMSGDVNILFSWLILASFSLLVAITALLILIRRNGKRFLRVASWVF